ncbi:hypothetical protein VT85_26360 (plasmid) [Planctomyces sp. SH-PL62]|nr:hypothetical protein VT85_26360 [Planctomyces sp. SH-PL62]
MTRFLDLKADGRDDHPAEVVGDVDLGHDHVSVQMVR